MRSFQLDSAEEAEVIEAIQASAGLGPSYLALLLLATVIATFGLIGNSTATVIGAMIVAPLMGPILGIALGLVRARLREFRRALLAELVGVGLCLVTSCLVALAMGSGVDLNQSEILARTRPTLIDLAIGFSAGLAGAYCTVNRKVGGSIAGVAIAVALVPPLCVSGLCLGKGSWSLSMGAFVLFAANFLTIQMAAIVVFQLAGLGHWQDLFKDSQLRRAFLLNLLLLLLTGVFLTQQLRGLLEERKIERVCRRVIENHFARLPGAALDGLETRREGRRLHLEIRARAPEEIGVAFAAELEKGLEQQLPYQVDLRIGTALATYVTPAGRIFAPSVPDPEPRAILLEDSRWALTQALAQFPGVELTNLTQVEVTGDGQSLFLSVRSPYVFDSRQVARLQSLSQELLARRQPRRFGLALTVRTGLIQEYTAEGLRDVEVPGDELRRAREKSVRQWLEEKIDTLGQSQLEELLVSLSPAGSETLTSVRARVLSRRPLPTATLKAWRSGLQELVDGPVELAVRVEIGYLTTLTEVKAEPEGPSSGRENSTGTGGQFQSPISSKAAQK